MVVVALAWYNSRTDRDEFGDARNFGLDTPTSRAARITWLRA